MYSILLDASGLRTVVHSNVQINCLTRDGGRTGEQGRVSEMLSFVSGQHGMRSIKVRRRIDEQSN